MISAHKSISFEKAINIYLLVWGFTPWVGQMANCTGLKCAGMTLQIDKLDAIQRFAAGGYGVCTIVAGLTV
jgi:hypothetical protein